MEHCLGAKLWVPDSALPFFLQRYPTAAALPPAGRPPPAGERAEAAAAIWRQWKWCVAPAVRTLLLSPGIPLKINTSAHLHFRGKRVRHFVVVSSVRAFIHLPFLLKEKVSQWGPQNSKWRLLTQRIHRRSPSAAVPPFYFYTSIHSHTSSFYNDSKLHTCSSSHFGPQRSCWPKFWPLLEAIMTQPTS